MAIIAALSHLKSHWSKVQYFQSSYCKFFHKRVILGSLWQSLKMSLVLTWEYSQGERMNIFKGRSRSKSPICRHRLRPTWSCRGISHGRAGAPASAGELLTWWPGFYSSLLWWNGSLGRWWCCKIERKEVKFQILYLQLQQSRFEHSSFAHWSSKQNHVYRAALKNLFFNWCNRKS